MTKTFDDIISDTRESLRGKTNSSTNELYSDSDIYVIAIAQWKKSHGGVAPIKEVNDNWRHLEFFMPITEASSIGGDFLIKGVAINETTTRNGVKYIASELEKAAPSFRNKPILLNHENRVENIVGRTTENVNFSHSKGAIEFEARIVDTKIKDMINQHLITNVSIGAKVSDLLKEKDSDVVTAIGIEGLEISFVAVPGDPGATLAFAMAKGYQLKEQLDMAKKVAEELDYKESKIEEQEIIKAPIIKHKKIYQETEYIFKI